MEMGEHWAYRVRPKELGSAVRQVEIVRVGGPGRTGGVHVRFLEGDAAGLQEWVNPTCLVTPWAKAGEFHADDAAELALAEASRHVRGSTEFEAARLILGFVRPKSRLRLRRGVQDAGILDMGRLDETVPLIGMDSAKLRDDPMVYENRDGQCLAGWPVTERLARHVADRLADVILPEVDRKQQSLEQERAQSSWYSSYSRRDDRKLDAEAAVLKTVRVWCGVDKSERYDELVALRAEVIRLGQLVERAVTTLRDRGHGFIASTIERELGVHISSLDPDVRR
ncbi:PE-PGRS family protein [Streptomyces microflavus]|uniref:PE-PGRS family protein n=1 Tax=Streptomyces microflavus TaxID=1919 RepID=UPI00332B4F1C